MSRVKTHNPYDAPQPNDDWAMLGDEFFQNTEEVNFDTG